MLPRRPRGLRHLHWADAPNPSPTASASAGASTLGACSLHAQEAQVSAVAVAIVRDARRQRRFKLTRPQLWLSAVAEPNTN
jgi:hypothetical protein